MRDATEDLRICEAATKGPFVVSIEGPNIYIREKDRQAFPIASIGRMHHEKEAEDNARFFAEARIALPHWIHRAVATAQCVAEEERRAIAAEAQIALNERQRLKEAADREEDIYHTVERMRKAEKRVAELEGRLNDHQILMAVLINKAGGEATFTARDLLAVESGQVLEREDDVSGGYKLRVTP